MLGGVLSHILGATDDGILGKLPKFLELSFSKQQQKRILMSFLHDYFCKILNSVSCKSIWHSRCSINVHLFFLPFLSRFLRFKYTFPDFELFKNFDSTLRMVMIKII